MAWIEEKLGDLCSVITDGAHQSPKTLENSGYPMASVKDMTPYGLNLDTCRHISPEDFEKLVKQGCKPEVNDVLLAKDGNSCLDTVLLQKDEQHVVLLSSVAILRPNKDKIVSQYLALYLSDTKVKRHMKENLVSGSAIPRVVLKALRDYTIKIPPISIQQKISDIIGSLDDKVELNLRMNETLEQMAMALYKHWFVDNQECQRVSIDTFSVIIGGGTPKTSESSYWNGDIPWISVRDLSQTVIFDTEKYITHKGLNNSSTKLIPQYATVLSARGTIGNISILGREMAMNQSCFAINSTQSIPVFTYLTLKSSIHELIRNSHGSVFNSISKETLLSLEVPYEIDKSIQFEGKVQPLFLQIASNNLEIKQLQQTRDYLLPRLLSGEIELHEAEKQVEEVI